MRAERDAVLVTGGAGFIGSELVSQLVFEGRRVIVLDDLSTGRTENLDDLQRDRVELVEGDVRDCDLAPLLFRVSTVFHLACRNLRRSLRAPAESHDVNATGTLRLLEAARAAGIRRFVHVSSSEVYGSLVSTAMTEDHRTYPTTAYGASKLAGESYARAFHASYGFPAVVVRPFNAYGPRCRHEGDSGEVIPKFLLRCLAGRSLVVFGDGEQTRDFTHVSDTARGIRLAAEFDSAIGETFNLGSGREVPIRELARLVAGACGRENIKIVHDEGRPGDVRALRADPTRARKILGWEPRVPLTEGLASLVRWYSDRRLPAEELLRDDTVRNWEVSADAI